jgi:hypothetical protein
MMANLLTSQMKRQQVATIRQSKNELSAIERQISILPSNVRIAIKIAK